MTEVEFTHPDVFSRGVAEGWAEDVTDPALIDWTERQAAAAIPFAVVDGRPVRPSVTTVLRRGRNELGHWGEAQAADAVVTATLPDGHRYLVVIVRGDGHGLALPGGYLNAKNWIPVENPVQAAVRELREETGLDLSRALWTAGEARVVPDPRGSDESWMVTTPVHADLGLATHLPKVAGADDAKEAVWAAADSYADLEAFAESIGEQIFPAHVAMLRDLLDNEGASWWTRSTASTPTPRPPTRSTARGRR